MLDRDTFYRTAQGNGSSNRCLAQIDVDLLHKLKRVLSRKDIVVDRRDWTGTEQESQREDLLNDSENFASVQECRRSGQRAGTCNEADWMTS